MAVRNISAATGRFSTSVNGAASAPALTLTGTIFTGGTGTTTKPHFLIEPAGTTSTDWSTAGTLYGGNAPAGFTGHLLDLQINGVYKFRVASSGNFGSGALTQGGFRTNGSAAESVLLNGSAYCVHSCLRLSFEGQGDVQIGRSAAGVAEVNNGTPGTRRDLGVRNLIQALTTPASAAATGVAGTITADADFVYVATATDTWKRVAIATW